MDIIGPGGDIAGAVTAEEIGSQLIGHKEENVGPGHAWTLRISI